MRFPPEITFGSVFLGRCAELFHLKICRVQDYQTHLVLPSLNRIYSPSFSLATPSLRQQTSSSFFFISVVQWVCIWQKKKTTTAHQLFPGSFEAWVLLASWTTVNYSFDFSGRNLMEDHWLWLVYGEMKKRSSLTHPEI